MYWTFTRSKGRLLIGFRQTNNDCQFLIFQKSHKQLEPDLVSCFHSPEDEFVPSSKKTDIFV